MLFPHHKCVTGNLDPVRVAVDGVDIGTVQKARDRSQTVTLDEGSHCLEFFIDRDQNAFAHTFWCFSRL